jgi:hypothetical protein
MQANKYLEKKIESYNQEADWLREEIKQLNFSESGWGDFHKKNLLNRWHDMGHGAQADAQLSDESAIWPQNAPLEKHQESVQIHSCPK